LNEAEQEMLAEGRDFKVCLESVHAHDEILLHNINVDVGEEDVLWHLGDFAWGDYENVRKYRERIKCKDIRLIWGNHDKRAIKDFFTECHEQLLIKLNGRNIFLNHYPMKSWDRSHHGSWQLFGHVHGGLADDPGSLQVDVGVDTHNFRPWSFEQLQSFMDEKYPIWKQSRNQMVPKERGGMTPIRRKND